MIPPLGSIAIGSLVDLKDVEKETEETEKLIDVRNARERVTQLAQISIKADNESMVDWNLSEVVVQPRGFPTHQFYSKYFTSDITQQSVQDFMTQVGVNAGCNVPFAKAGFSTSVSGRDFSSVSGKTESGVLLIVSIVTSQNVRIIKNLQYDFKKIPLDKIDKMIAERVLLTECIMGGAFVGICKFSKRENNSRTMNKSVSEFASEVAAGWFGMGGNISTSFKSARELERLASSGSIDLEIEFTSLGAVPQMTRHDVSYTLSEFENLTPSKLDLSRNEESDVSALVSLSGLSGLDAKAAEMQNKRRIRMENSQMTIMNTIRATRETEKKHKVHTLESLYEAFEYFVDEMNKNVNSGIPFGFNYRRINPIEILEAKSRAKIYHMRLLTEEMRAVAEYQKTREEFMEKCKDETVLKLIQQNIPESLLNNLNLSNK